MGKVFYFGDAIERSGDVWVRNEEEAQSQGVVYEGGESAAVQESRQGSKRAKLRPNASLGFDGQDVHVGGDRVTLRGEERLSNGDVVTYWQHEKGGTLRQRWTPDGDRRLVPAEKPWRTRSF